MCASMPCSSSPEPAPPPRSNITETPGRGQGTRARYPRDIQSTYIQYSMGQTNCGDEKMLYMKRPAWLGSQGGSRGFASLLLMLSSFDAG